MGRALSKGEPGLRSGVPALAPKLLQRLAARAADYGATVELEPRFGATGRLLFKDGRSFSFHGTRFDLNGAGASAMAGDKFYALQRLEEAGLKVPQSALVFSQAYAAEIGRFRPDIADAIGLETGLQGLARQAERIGFPLIAKPNEGRGGTGVTWIPDAQTLREQGPPLLERHAKILLQKLCKGREARLLLLDGEVVAAYERRPSGPASAPAQPANLSAGGRPLPLSLALIKALKPEALAAACALDLRLAGIDLFFSGEDRPVLLEVNAAPGLTRYAEAMADEGALTAFAEALLAAHARTPKGAP